MILEAEVGMAKRKPPKVKRRRLKTAAKVQKFAAKLGIGRNGRLSADNDNIVKAIQNTPWGQVLTSGDIKWYLNLKLHLR